MGVTLMLYPLMQGPSALQETRILGMTVIELHQDYRILGQIGDVGDGTSDVVVKAQPLPPQFWFEYLGEEAIERTREDRNGAPLTFVYAEELRKVKLPEDSSPWNKAVFAFIKALPRDTPIILMWS